MDKVYKGLEDDFENKDNETFKSYAKLNYLFIKASGVRSLQDYNNPGKVSSKVIEDM